MASIIRAGIRGDGYARLQYALRNCLPFTTSGAFRGGYHTTDTVSRYDLGWLNSDEANRFMIDHLAGISYVVWSYDTPIAWVRDDGTVYRVSQKFSATTSRHQSKLYMLGGA